MARYVQTRGEAYRWGMLTWFNQLLLEQGVITEAEFTAKKRQLMGI